MRRQDRRRERWYRGPIQWHRCRFWNFDPFFDDAGYVILSHWLSGSGEPLILTDGRWGDYMRENELLRRQLKNRLESDCMGRRSEGQFDDLFNAEIENGYNTGYEMLHGTNADVGGFEMSGTISSTSDSVGNTTICYNII